MNLTQTNNYMPMPIRFFNFQNGEQLIFIDFWISLWGHRLKESGEGNLTVLLGTIYAEEMVVSPEDSVSVLHLCLLMNSRAVHTSSTSTQILECEN